MSDDYITLTDIDVDRCMTERGAFRAESVRMLGEDMTVKGWRLRLRGKKVLRSDYDQARLIAKAPRLSGVPHGETQGQTILGI